MINVNMSFWLRKINLITRRERETERERGRESEMGAEGYLHRDALTSEVKNHVKSH